MKTKITEIPFFRIRYLLIICILFALFFVGQQFFWASAFEKDFDFFSHFAYELFYTFTWGVLLFPIIALGNRFRIEKSSWLTTVPIHIVAAIIIGLVHKFASSLLHFAVFSPYTFFGPKFPKILLKTLGGSFDSIIVYWFILGAFYGFDYYYKLSKSKVKESELEKELAQANLQALKMQLHPHFLFNTLHAVSTLMQEDIKAARRMLVKLSDLLRVTLDNIGVHEVVLNDEIDFLKSYLEIEQIRFGKRLTINYNIEPETLSASVPNLILQPLVENAIKHGIANNKEGGTINIESRIAENNLLLKVSDDCKSNGECKKEGIGLTNTRKRLKHLYGENFSLETESKKSGFSVFLSFPYKRFVEPKDSDNE